MPQNRPSNFHQYELVMEKLDVLYDKIEKLNISSQNYITKSDLESLRRELASTYVPILSYDPNHKIMENELKRIDTTYSRDVNDLQKSFKKHEEDAYRALEKFRTEQQEREEKRVKQGISHTSRLILYITSISAVVLSALDMVLHYVVK